MIAVRVPDGPEEIEAVRDLMRAFLAWHRSRHPEDTPLIDKYFPAKVYEAELAGLPGKYAPPSGALLLALLDGEPAGCVALQGIDAASCEMKRMFVHPHLHGRGLGRKLGAAIIAEATRMGYRTMLLDTSFRQTEAQTLYRSLGFRDRGPYQDLPRELQEWLVFMELTLPR